MRPCSIPVAIVLAMLAAFLACPRREEQTSVLNEPAGEWSLALGNRQGSKAELFVRPSGSSAAKWNAQDWESVELRYAGRPVALREDVRAALLAATEVEMTMEGDECVMTLGVQSGDSLTSRAFILPNPPPP
jgi:hypothetical protein